MSQRTDSSFGLNRNIPTIDARKLCVGYGTAPVLRDLTFRVEAGRCLGIVGPSGSGKSTLLLCLSGISAPLGGALSGSAIDKSGDIQSTLVFQDVRLFPHLTIFENVVVGIRADKERITALLGRLDIDGLGDRLPSSISTGQRQRAAIARAIVRDLPVLLLDEPSSALDKSNTRRLSDVLAEQIMHGTAVVIATHDYTLLQSLSAQVLVLRDGTGFLFENVESALSSYSGI